MRPCKPFVRPPHVRPSQGGGGGAPPPKRLRAFEFGQHSLLDQRDAPKQPHELLPRRPRRSNVQGLEAWRIGWRSSTAMDYIGALTGPLTNEHLRLF